MSLCTTCIMQTIYKYSTVLDLLDFITSISMAAQFYGIFLEVA